LLLGEEAFGGSDGNLGRRGVRQKIGDDNEQEDLLLLEAADSLGERTWLMRWLRMKTLLRSEIPKNDK
jgi:hypothetical protein